MFKETSSLNNGIMVQTKMLKVSQLRIRLLVSQMRVKIKVLDHSIALS